MTEGSRRGGGPGSGGELADLRRQIDALDREIVRLLNERARLGLAAGRAKIAAGQPVPDPDREREVLVRVAMANDGPLGQADVLRLFRGLVEAIRTLEERDGDAAPRGRAPQREAAQAEAPEAEAPEAEAPEGEAPQGKAAPDGGGHA